MMVMAAQQVNILNSTELLKIVKVVNFITYVLPQYNKGNWKNKIQSLKVPPFPNCTFFFFFFLITTSGCCSPTQRQSPFPQPSNLALGLAVPTGCGRSDILGCWRWGPWDALECPLSLQESSHHVKSRDCLAGDKSRMEEKALQDEDHMRKIETPQSTTSTHSREWGHLEFSRTSGAASVSPAWNRDSHGGWALPKPWPTEWEPTDWPSEATASSGGLLHSNR